MGIKDFEELIRDRIEQNSDYARVLDGVIANIFNYAKGFDDSEDAGNFLLDMFGGTPVSITEDEILELSLEED